MKLGHAMVATDFSPDASAALRRAAAIARVGGIDRLSIVHVLERRLLDALRDLAGRGPDDRIGRIIEERLREQADELRERAGRDVCVRLLEGDRRSALVEEARRLHCGLIVVGARGAGLMRRLLLGSTSDRLVSSAPAAVLVVKRRAVKRYRRVLLPVDLQTPPDDALELARSLAPGADLILMQAYEVPFEGQLRYASVGEADIVRYRERAHDEAVRALHELQDRLIRPGETIGVHAVHGTPDPAILDAEGTLKPDLLVLPRHAAGRVEHWVLGSVARRIVERCRSDIAVLPPHRS